MKSLYYTEKNACLILLAQLAPILVAHVVAFWTLLAAEVIN